VQGGLFQGAVVVFDQNEIAHMSLSQNPSLNRRVRRIR
jgi:hypothetical protein